MTGERLRAIVGLVAGLALMVSPLAMRPAGADSSAFLSFELNALADGFTMTGGSPSSEGFPQMQGRVPHTETVVETGPRARALSSGAWPGPLAANAGSLAVLLGGPEEAGAANYPVFSEAQSPAGPFESEQSPGFRAEARTELAEAIGQVDDFGNDAFFVGSVHTNSRSEVSGDLGVATARSENSDISFGGGQVTIESVITTARASTDGVTSEVGGSTVVSGLVVGGQPARVDEDGVHFGSQDNPNPADAVAQQIGEQVLSNFGMELYTTSPVQSSEGGSASYRSGSLIIVWDVFNQGQGIGVWEIGGSAVDVRASPALPLPVFEPPPPPTFAAPVTSPPVVSGVTPPPPTAAPVTEAPAAPTEVALPPAVTPIEPAPISADFFDGIPWLFVLAALVGSWLAARSLAALQAQTTAPVDHCPLDRR